MNLVELQALVAQGESERLEFKKSTGELKGGMETLCAFLNGQGGHVLFGVSTAGVIVGRTLRTRLSKKWATNWFGWNHLPTSS